MSTKTKGDILAERIEEILERKKAGWPDYLTVLKVAEALVDYRKPWTLGRSINGFTLGDGQEWHRNDWTEDMLPEGYRPCIKGEKINECTEMGPYDWRNIPSRTGEGINEYLSSYYRTRRPLPSVNKMIPLGPEDVLPGSILRHIERINPWSLVLAVHPWGVKTIYNQYTWDEAKCDLEISRDNGKTWQKCEKESK